MKGYSDGISFSLRISNGNLVLRMFDQDLLFEREDEVASGYTTPLETLSHKDVANNSSSDPFVGNFNGSGVENTPINLQITKGQSEGEYQLYFNGLSPQRGMKSGQFLTIAESGVEFNFEAILDGLILK